MRAARCGERLLDLPMTTITLPPGKTACHDMLLVSAAEAARLCGRSKASWWRDHAAEGNPAPGRLGGRTLWRVEELRRWADAGCPDRKIWEALRRQEGGRR